MLTRLRWRFIWVSTLSLALVLALMFVGINVLYRVQFDRNADSILRMIAEREGHLPPVFDKEERRAIGQPLFSPESPYDTRFFLVWLTEDDQIEKTQMDRISAVTEDNVAEYVTQALETGKIYGYVEQFRFYHCTDYNKPMLVFLSCYRTRTMTRNLLWISLTLSLTILLGAAIVLYAFSRRAIAPAEKSMERQQRFITDASHEIKTPVTVIASYASLMTMEDPDNEWAQTIEKETGRLSALVTNLVKLSRWDEEGPVVSRERFSFSEAVWDLLPTYQKLAESNGQAVTIDIQEGVTCQGDEDAVQNAVSVLLENAVQYAVGASPIAVSLGTKRKTALLRITNECDLPPELEVERLFDRFYRADPARSRSTGGNGVGLSLARAIVEAHNGSLRAHREQNTIIFELSLPLA